MNGCKSAANNIITIQEDNPGLGKYCYDHFCQCLNTNTVKDNNPRIILENWFPGAYSSAWLFFLNNKVDRDFTVGKPLQKIS